MFISDDSQSRCSPRSDYMTREFIDNLHRQTKCERCKKHYEERIKMLIQKIYNLEKSLENLTSK